YVESFNARLRDELLNGEIFYTLREAQIVIESWRCHYNTIRPHASLGYKPPAPEVFLPAFAAWPAALRRPAPPATLAPRPTLNQHSTRTTQWGLINQRILAADLPGRSVRYPVSFCQWNGAVAVRAVVVGARVQSHSLDRCYLHRAARCRVHGR